MKKLTYLILTLSLVLTACTGDQGPPGPPGFGGLDGLDGLPSDEFAARSFERTVDFVYFNDTGLQEVLVTLPTAILDRDAVLVYRLEDVVDVGGQPADAWSPLPQNFFLTDGDIIQYIFNHTFVDVQLFIDGNFDLSFLGSEFTQNQTFRFIVLPVENLNGVDISNMNEVMEIFNIESFKSL